MKNPTLVHHGKAKRARFHLWAKRAGGQIVALAELYDGTMADAKRLAARFANKIRGSVFIGKNPPGPHTFAYHERHHSSVRGNPAEPPVFGQVWKEFATGRRVRISSPAAGGRVWVTDMESGNRETVGVKELQHTFTRVVGSAPRRNPKGRKNERRRMAHRDSVTHIFGRKELDRLTLNETTALFKDIAEIADAEQGGDDGWAAFELRRRIGGPANLKSYAQSLVAGGRHLNPSRSSKARASRALQRKALGSRRIRRAVAAYQRTDAGSRARSGAHAKYVMAMRSSVRRRTPRATHFANPKGRRRAGSQRPGPGTYSRTRSRGPVRRTPNPRGRCAANPRGSFLQGERVTVPYTGRSSYFGRPVKRTREPATVEGVNADGSVMVTVHRGRSAESHTFEPHLVRRRPRKGGAARKERGLAVRARLEAAALKRRHKEASAAADKAERDRECAEAKAKVMDPATTGYSRLLAQIRRLTAEVEAQRAIAYDIEKQDPQYFAPWSAGPIANPSRHTMSRARRTFKGWHEFDPSELIRVKGPDRVIPKVLVGLGEVSAIEYRSDKRDGGRNTTGKVETYRHTTKSPRPILATDPDGKHVHLVGGRMKPTPLGLVN